MSETNKPPQCPSFEGNHPTGHLISGPWSRRTDWVTSNNLLNPIPTPPPVTVPATAATPTWLKGQFGLDWTTVSHYYVEQ